MGASMSAPTPISQDPSDIAVEFNGLAPAAVGTVNRKAAPASHAHPVNALGRKVKGFGVALHLSVSPYSASGFSGGIGTPGSIPTMAEFCLEFWSYVSANDYNGSAYFGLQSVPASELTFTGHNVVGWTNNQAPGTNTGIIWPDGTIDACNAPPGTGSPYTHWAISGDGTTLRAFQNGSLIASHAQSGPVGGYLNIIGIDANPDLYLDEVRLSSTARYTADFAVPIKPFTADNATVVLWSFDDLLLGQFLANNTATVYPSVSADSSGNGNVVDVVTNGGTGGASGLTASGLISTVTSTSGVGTAYSVLSLQAQRGDLVLTDTAGNSVATPVPQTDGTIQLQMAALSAGATPWTSIPYWLLRVD